MPTKRPYMKTTERGYHPAEWFVPVIVNIVVDDYSDYAKIVRSELLKDHVFPLVVVRGARDVLRELEYRYDTKIRSMFPEKSYDELKKLTVTEIQSKHFDNLLDI